MKVIIIEGCDCSGKNFVIERLSKKLKNSFVMKNNFKPKTEDESDLIKWKYDGMLEAIQTFNSKKLYDYIIMNRWYPSELVYSGLKRDYDAMNDSWYESFENKLISLKSEDIEFIVVWVTCDDVIIIDRLKVRGDEHITINDVANIQNKYKGFLEKSKLNSITITSHDADKLLKYLEVKYG